MDSFFANCSLNNVSGCSGLKKPAGLSHSYNAFDFRKYILDPLLYTGFECHDTHGAGFTRTMERDFDDHFFRELYERDVSIILYKKWAKAGQGILDEFYLLFLSHLRVICTTSVSGSSLFLFSMAWSTFSNSSSKYILAGVPSCKMAGRPASPASRTLWIRGN